MRLLIVVAYVLPINYDLKDNVKTGRDISYIMPVQYIKTRREDDLMKKSMAEINDELDRVISHMRVLQAAITNRDYNEISESEGIVMQEIIDRMILISEELQSE